MADMQKSGTVYQTSEEALAAYEAHLKTVGKTVDWAAAKNKLLSASMKVLSTVGWMAVMTLATELLSAGIRKIDDYIHRVENAREKLEETTSDLESVESELKSIGEQIDDILSKGELSITDENDLKRLQLENEELERRKKLLELQKQEESKELNEAAEDKYRKQFQTKRVSVWIPEDERVNNVNPNQTRATKSVTQEEKFAYNLKLAKELASYEGKITEEQAKQYEELQTYFLEQADSLSDIKDGYNAITPEQQEQLKIWNQMIDDAIWVSENFPGSAKNVTSRLMDKFAGGFNKNDGSTYLSTSDIDKQIGSWIDSLSEDEKLILLQCDIEDATLDDLKSYLKEQTKELEIKSSESKKTCEQIVQECASLEAEILGTRADISNKKQELARFEAELRACTNELSNSVLALEISDKELKDCTQKIAILNNDRKNATDQIAKLNFKISEAEEKVNNITGSRAKLIEQREEIASMLQSVRFEIVNAQKDIDVLNSEILFAENSSSNNKERKNQLLSQIEGYKSKSKEISLLITNLTQEAEKLDSEIKNLTALNERISKEIKAFILENLLLSIFLVTGITNIVSPNIY